MPTVRRIPPKKLQPSNLLPLLSGFSVVVVGAGAFDVDFEGVVVAVVAIVVFDFFVVVEVVALVGARVVVNLVVVDMVEVAAVVGVTEDELLL